MCCLTSHSIRLVRKLMALDWFFLSVEINSLCSKSIAPVQGYAQLFHLLTGGVIDQNNRQLYRLTGSNL